MARAGYLLRRIPLVAASVAALPAAWLAVQPVVIPERDRVEQESSGSVVPVRPISDSLTEAVVRNNVFRRQRSPAPVRFSVAPAEPEEATDPPKPAPLLTGIVWGDRPAAILEGLPGWEEGRLLRAGEIADGIHVRRIERDRVILSGYDTTWTLRVRKPW